MKIFNTKIPSMYLWAILLLSILAVIGSYFHHQIPWNILGAVVVASVLDILVKIIYLKRELTIPYSAMISGLIIGSVAPFGSPILVGVVAAIIAILSKFFIRINDLNVFNPAALGLVVSLLIFAQGDDWWAASGYNFMGYLIPLSIILIIPNYKAHKIKIASSFLVTSFLIGYIFSLSTGSTFNMLTSFLQLSYYFAFIMVSEPQTSPYKPIEQIIFGVGVAVLSYGIGFVGVNYSFLIALLIGNIIYAIWRMIYSLKIRK